jgi:hypothetical protein
VTFRYIKSKNSESAAKGLISSETLTRRHRRHGINLRVTFLSVVAQVAMTGTNIMIFGNTYLRRKKAILVKFTAIFGRKNNHNIGFKIITNVFTENRLENVIITLTQIACIDQLVPTSKFTAAMPSSSRLESFFKAKENILFFITH